MPVSTATTAVQSAALAGTAAVHDMSVFGMFMQADFIVKSVMMMLLLASMWCWAIIFEKWMKLKSVNFRAKRFEDALWTSDDLDKFYNKIEKREDHPIAQVFLSGMREWYKSKQAGMNDSASKLAFKERMERIMQVAKNREVDGLERNLGFLATCGSVAPFIGLFGTVWGIMRSFTGIAQSQNASLAVVAPGIAEALFATAIGLFAAIPAVIFYNKLIAELGRFSGKLDDFSTEFGALISRQLDSSKG